MILKQACQGGANKKVDDNAKYNRAAMNSKSMHSRLRKPNTNTAEAQAGRHKTM